MTGSQSENTMLQLYTIVAFGLGRVLIGSRVVGVLARLLLARSWRRPGLKIPTTSTNSFKGSDGDKILRSLSLLDWKRCNDACWYSCVCFCFLCSAWGFIRYWKTDLRKGCGVKVNLKPVAYFFLWYNRKNSLAKYTALGFDACALRRIATPLRAYRGQASFYYLESMHPGQGRQLVVKVITAINGICDLREVSKITKF